MPRLPTKRAEKVAEAEEKGKLKALRQHLKKEPFTAKLERYLQHIIKPIDPLELVAVLGATVAIKSGIEWSEELIAKFAGTGDISNLSPIGSIPFPATERTVFSGLADWLNLIMPQKDLSTETKEVITQAVNKAMDTPQAEALQWLLSFTAAYLLVKQAENLDITSIVGSAKTLLGFGVA